MYIKHYYKVSVCIEFAVGRKGGAGLVLKCSSPCCKMLFLNTILILKSVYITGSFLLSGELIGQYCSTIGTLNAHYLLSCLSTKMNFKRGFSASRQEIEEIETRKEQRMLPSIQNGFHIEFSISKHQK